MTRRFQLHPDVRLNDARWTKLYARMLVLSFDHRPGVARQMLVGEKPLLGPTLEDIAVEGKTADEWMNELEAAIDRAVFRNKFHNAVKRVQYFHVRRAPVKTETLARVKQDLSAAARAILS